MIREYALDPDLLDTWDRARYYIEKFGWDQGRLIARFPSKWKRMVYDRAKDAGEVERKRIEQLLSDCDKRFFRAGRCYQPGLDWVGNAVAEHANRPFQAIITRAQAIAVPGVLANDEVNETHPLFRAVRQESARRTARDLAEKLRPLLECARRVLIIDPYFDPRPAEGSWSPKFRPTRWLEPLLAILMRLPDECEVEIHCSRPRRDGEKLVREADDMADRERWATACREKLPHLLPQGRHLALLYWQERDRGEPFHARYLATDRCAVSLDPGFDAEDRMEHEQVQIVLQQESFWQALIDRHARGAAVYTLLGRVDVVGVGDCLTEELRRRLG